MTIYAVFLNDPNPEAWRRIEEFRGRRACFLTDNMAFVATRAPASTEEIAAHAGVDEETGASGVVTEIAAYHGYDKSALWDWMRRRDERR